jgi:hypothetical protein
MTKLISDSSNKDSLNKEELVSLLSMFCDSSAKHDDSIDNATSTCKDTSETAKTIVDMMEQAYQREHETLGGYYITQEYQISSRLCPHVVNWCQATSSSECLAVLGKAYETAGISSGDFVKSLLKIIKLSKEIMTSAQEMGNSWLWLEKLCSEVPESLMKYVVTNQSLYI